MESSSHTRAHDIAGVVEVVVVVAVVVIAIVG